MIINQLEIAGQPVLEFVAKEKVDLPAPLAVFYHGWTSNKAVVAVNGMELAKRGFRAILPDALYHGENQPKEIETFADLLLVMTDSLDNFPQIVDHFASLTQDNFIAVGGLSMGGSITNMLMTQHPEINVAGSLMSTPAATDFIQFYFAEIASQREIAAPSVTQLPTGEPLENCDLSRHPAAINYRPMYFWHSKDDDWVPFQFAFPYIKKLQNLPEGKNIRFDITAKDGHHVPYQVSVAMADFFEEAYQKY